MGLDIALPKPAANRSPAARRPSFRPHKDKVEGEIALMVLRLSRHRHLTAVLIAGSAALLAGAPALAQDLPIATAQTGAPPPAAQDSPVDLSSPAAQLPRPDAQAHGEWARGILEGRSVPETRDTARSTRCASGPRRPTGEVWAGIGTRGYREVGGVVTHRIGECGSATIGVSRTEGRF